jgi:hypothetical protein
MEATHTKKIGRTKFTPEEQRKRSNQQKCAHRARKCNGSDGERYRETKVMLRAYWYYFSGERERLIAARAAAHGDTAERSGVHEDPLKAAAAQDKIAARKNALSNAHEKYLADKKKPSPTHKHARPQGAQKACGASSRPPEEGHRPDGSAQAHP